MVTLRQTLKKPKKTQKKSLTLAGAPQKKGICLKLFIMNPKKPNSAERKVARVKLSNNKIVVCYIPGEGHSLSEHSIVLVSGGKTKDLPGVCYKVIRNSYDFK